MTLLTWMSTNWEMTVFLVLVVAGLVAHCWSEFMQMLAARGQRDESEGVYIVPAGNSIPQPDLEFQKTLRRKPSLPEGRLR